MRVTRPHLRVASWPRVLLLCAGAFAAAGCVGAMQAAAPPPAASCRTPSPHGGAGAAVEWRLPPGDEERARLDRWCAPVGGPILLAGPRDPGGAPTDSIAIITWNTHGGGGEVVRLVEELRAGALTAGQPVTDFILLLQEVHRAGDPLPEALNGARVPEGVREDPPAGPRLDVEEAARALGLALVYVPSMRNGEATGADAEDRGNAILSTLPLRGPLAIELPIESQRRVAVAATVEGAGRGGRWEMTVVSAHLDTRSTGERILASFGAGRRRQAEALADALPAGGPTVLAGDLNTWSLGALESSLDFFRARFPATPPAPPGPTFTTDWGYSRRLDHMFFRLPPAWSARYERVGDRYGSDHHPLLAWVVMGGAQPTPDALAAGGPRPGS